MLLTPAPSCLSVPHQIPLNKQKPQPFPLPQNHGKTLKSIGTEKMTSEPSKRKQKTRTEEKETNSESEPSPKASTNNLKQHPRNCNDLRAKQHKQEEKVSGHEFSTPAAN